MVDIKRIGVIGAGTMGNGTAQVFAQNYSLWISRLPRSTEREHR